MKSLVERFLKWNQDSLFDDISNVQRIYSTIWECGGENFSEYECFFLLLIEEHPGITVNELRDMGGRTQGAVSQKLIDFEKRGLIRKEKLENDRRHTQICLTDKGKSVVEEVEQLKLRHSQDAIDVLLEHGYEEEQIGLFLEMYAVLEQYGQECSRMLYG